MKQLLSPLFIISILSLLPVGLKAQTDEEKARKISDQHGKAIVVVTVKGKLEATTSGDPLDTKDFQRRTLGVTIREDGLIVVSNIAIDQSVGLVGQQAKVDTSVVEIRTAKVEFTEVDISYGDKSLLSGKVVKQDQEADIAFIMPDPAEAKAIGMKFDYVNVADFDASIQEADKVVGLSRASSVYGYIKTVRLGRVTAVFKSDRTFYVTDIGISQGMPIFNLDGRVVGITVIRIINGQPSGVLGTLSAGSIQVMANLVPTGGNG